MLDKKSLSQLESIFSGISEPQEPAGRPARPRREARAEAAPSGWVWEVDTQGTCLWSSEEVRNLLGVSPARLRGRSLEEGGLPPESLDKLLTAMGDGEAIDNLVLTARDRTGANILLLVNALPRFDEEGYATTYRAVIQVLQSGQAAPTRARPSKPPRMAAPEPAPSARPVRKPVKGSVPPSEPPSRPKPARSLAAPIEWESPARPAKKQKPAEVPAEPAGLRKTPPTRSARPVAAGGEAFPAEPHRKPRQAAEAVPAAPVPGKKSRLTATVPALPPDALPPTRRPKPSKPAELPAVSPVAKPRPAKPSVSKSAPPAPAQIAKPRRAVPPEIQPAEPVKPTHAKLAHSKPDQKHPAGPVLSEAKRKTDTAGKAKPRVSPEPVPGIEKPSESTPAMLPVSTTGPLHEPLIPGVPTAPFETPFVAPRLGTRPLTPFPTITKAVEKDTLKPPPLSPVEFPSPFSTRILTPPPAPPTEKPSETTPVETPIATEPVPPFFEEAKTKPILTGAEQPPKNKPPAVVALETPGLVVKAPPSISESPETAPAPATAIGEPPAAPPRSILSKAMAEEPALDLPFDLPPDLLEAGVIEKLLPFKEQTAAGASLAGLPSPNKAAVEKVEPAAAETAAVTTPAPAPGLSAPVEPAPAVETPTLESLWASTPPTPSVPPTFEYTPPAPKPQPSGPLSAPAGPPREILPLQSVLMSEGPEGFQQLESYNTPETQRALATGDVVITQPGEGNDGRNNSVMAVPIHLSDQVLGVMEFSDQSSLRHWSDEDRMLAEEITDQLALALENARLFHQAAQRSQELALINRVVSSVAGSLDLRSSLDTVAQELAQALNLGHASISLLSEDRSTLTLVSDQPGRFDRTSIGLFVPVKESAILQQALESTGPSLFTGLKENPLRPVLSGEQHEHRTRALLLLPLMAEGSTIGLVGLHILEETRSFTQDELRLAETIVAQASTAIQNAQLHTQTEQALREAVTLFQTSQRLQQATGEDQLLQAAVDSCKTAVSLHSVSIQLFGEETGQSYVMQVAHLADSDMPTVEDGTRFPGTLYPFFDLLVHGETVVSNHCEDDERLSGMVRPILSDLSIASMVAVPLRVRGENIGILQAVRRVVNPYTHNEIRFLETVGGQLSVALDNYRLLDQAQRRAQQLEIAAEVSRLATSTLETGTLLSRAVNLLLQRFGFYHTAVFLLDEQGKNAVVREATGTAGIQMKENKHSLGVGSRSIVGQVTEGGKFYVAFDTQKDPYFRPHPSLPETRAELALPLKIGDRVLGVLDIQSNRANAFAANDIAVLQSLADQIAVALDNARSYEVEREALKELREVDRVKTQFLANMSHELRTPLNSIIGFSRVILKGIDGPITDLQHQDLTAIHNAGQHLLGLINDILDISRIDAGKMELAFEEVDLRSLIQSVSSTALGLLKDKPIRLSQYIPDDLPLARADPIRARQVLLNLLSNAAKFTEAGSIVIEAKLQKSPDGFPEILISVSDTGTGIPAEHIGKLFEPFSQVDTSPTRKTGGTGLGLSICRRLVEMHGGRIWVDSILGKGSSFYFSLPAIKAKGSTGPITAPTGSLRKTILVVENEPEVVKLYRRYLEPKSYTIVDLTDGARAVPVARELRPFAILLDVNMPAPDGWQVLAQLKSDPITRPIPVILCTITEDRGRGLSLGAADYLVKPILEADLVASLEKLDKPDRKAHNVLVIEDNPEEAQLVQRILAKLAGFSARMVSEGKTAVEIAINDQPNLILLDLQLPGTSGFQVLAMLRSNEKTVKIPVIVMTEADLTKEQQDTLAATTVGVLRKTQFSERDLLEHIVSALNLYDRKSTSGTSPLGTPGKKPSTNPLPEPSGTSGK